MKYWAYINNEVLGPFEKEKLAELANFGLSSLICPQTPVGGQTESWKEASTYPEVSAALTSPAPPPVSPQRRAAESPLAMTMRGSLILAPGDPDTALAPPGIVQLQKPGGSAVSGMPDEVKFKPLAAEPPKDPTKPVLEDSLSSKTPSTFPGGGQADVPDKTQARAENILTRRELNSQLEPLNQKLEQMGALLVSIGDSQFQLLGRLSRLESAILEIKAALEPKKDD